MGTPNSGIFRDLGAAALPVNGMNQVIRNSVAANGVTHGIEVDTGQNLVAQNTVTNAGGGAIYTPGCAGCAANTVGPIETNNTGISTPWANMAYPN